MNLIDIGIALFTHLLAAAMGGLVTYMLIDVGVIHQGTEK